MNTMIHKSILSCVLAQALVKLDDCRAKCPGCGGDVDAMNLRYMIERQDFVLSAIEQAADRLAQLSTSLGIDASTEVSALRVVVDVRDPAPTVAEVLADPSVRHAAKQLLGASLQRDSVDAINDVELVGRVLRAHWFGEGRTA